MRLNRKLQRGFTLAEMLMVIVITGILGGMVALFLRWPVQGYVDSARRAEMTDIADTASHRLARDIRTAVPNSVRLPDPAGSNYIEFLPTKAGGRYRAADAVPAGTLCASAPYNAPGDTLSFAGDTCFEILGPPITFAVGDQIVINSTLSGGNQPYDNTATGILRAYNTGVGGVGAKSIVVMDATPYPAGFNTVQSGQRFDVVPGDQQAVTYACIGTLGVLDANKNGQASLMRYWSYGFNPAQVAPPLGGLNAVLADKISSCNIVYDAVNQLVFIMLGITRGGESISLYQEIHVNNAP